MPDERPIVERTRIECTGCGGLIDADMAIQRDDKPYCGECQGQPIVDREGPIKFYRSSRPYGFLSNLYKCSVEFEGRMFRSSEDAYQFGKPKDIATAEWLVSAPKPHLCAVAAHALLPWDIRPDWNGIKLERMRKVVMAKFEQNEDLREMLLATGKRWLMEDSPTDKFWGIGKKGDGCNFLGQILMETRKYFRYVR